MISVINGISKIVLPHRLSNSTIHYKASSRIWIGLEEPLIQNINFDLLLDIVKSEMNIFLPYFSAKGRKRKDKGMVRCRNADLAYVRCAWNVNWPIRIQQEGKTVLSWRLMCVNRKSIAVGQLFLQDTTALNVLKNELIIQIPNTDCKKLIIWNIQCAPKLISLRRFLVRVWQLARHSSVS